MYILPCNGMLQGHDALIIENKNKKKRRQKDKDAVRKLFPPILQLTNIKKNAAFQAQSSTNEKEEENN